MDFDLTEGQRRIRETLTDFAEREIKPHSTRWDKDETFARHVIEQLGELGFLGVAFPEKFGGGGADTLSQVLVVEGLSRYDASIGLTCAAHMSLSTGHIAGFASDEQRGRYVPAMLQAKKLGAWCLTESSSGSDAAAMRTRATRGGFEEARASALERGQFGKKIAEFQAIQWMFADMAPRIDAAWVLICRAAALKDAGKPFAREAAMAKLFASETAMWSTIKAVQIHGGYGYVTYFPVERYMRDAKLSEIGEGTSEIKRMIFE